MGRLLDSAILFFHQIAAEDQRVHARTEKRADGVGGRMDDSLTAEVKGRIHDDGHAGTLAEFVDEAVVERIDFLLHGLRAGAAVHVGDGGDDAALSGRTGAVRIINGESQADSKNLGAASFLKEGA
jgi:hypothetical protein